MSEIITQQSERVTRFLSIIDRMTEALDKLSKSHAPRFGGEHYVTDTELTKRLKISYFATQEWRSSSKIPFEHSNQSAESKGFYDPVVVQDFPIRGKKVFLNIRRHRWILKDENRYISRNWCMVPGGTRMTQDFASFLKLLY